MKFPDLKKLIEEIASQNKIEKDIVIKDLAEILKIKYGISIMEKERELIDEVRNKIITKLYNSEDQIISTDVDQPKTYKLDLLEGDYMKMAMDELQQEGLIHLSKNTISLSKEGIMKFKEFYGEI